MTRELTKWEKRERRAIRNIGRRARKRTTGGLSGNAHDRRKIIRAMNRSTEQQ